METQERLKKMKTGTHFWALCDGLLVVLAKKHDDCYDVCGAWECGYRLEDVDEILQIIEVPKGYESHNFIYFKKQ